MRNKGYEYFYRIKGLILPEDFSVNVLDNNINSFIDTIDSLSDSITEAFHKGEYDVFMKNMETILLILSRVYAKWLVTEGRIILKDLQNNNINQARKQVEPFVTNLRTLSIEMQRAQGIDTDADVEESEMDGHVEIAYNLSAVDTLINNGEYEEAKAIIAGIGGEGSQALIGNLLNLVINNKYEEAGQLARILKNSHLVAITDFMQANQQKIILAVDDRPEILSTISHIFEKYYKVIGVTNGKAALKVLSVHNPDLFILDIDMPEMNGYQLAETIRSFAKHKSTPIIFLTGHSSRLHVVKAMKAGGNDFIIKPANHDVLLTKVSKHLKSVSKNP